MPVWAHQLGGLKMEDVPSSFEQSLKGQRKVGWAHPECHPSFSGGIHAAVAGDALSTVRGTAILAGSQGFLWDLADNG